MRIRPVFAVVLVGIIELLVISSLAVAKETDSGMPLSGIGSSPQPDLFTGTLTTSIPIDVPPGRNAVQPSLALTYGSANGNGWVGMGWKLEHGGIFRQDKFGVSYANNTGQNAFVMRMSGLGGDLVEAPGLPGEWRAKIEGSFTRVQQVGSGSAMYWIATTRDGRRFYFGQNAGSRLADPSDATKIYAWCLDKVIDLDGNYMEMTYWSDSHNNQGYLDQIRYGGHDGTGGVTPKAHTHVITFYRDAGNRLDQPDMYMANYRMRTKHLLKTIEVKANGSPVRAYELNYSLSSSASRSVLSSVKQHGSDAGVDASGTISPGTSLPATTFGYSSDTQTFTDGNAWTTGWCSGGTVTVGRDMNGDGRQDMLCYTTPTSTSHSISPLISGGSGTFASPGGFGCGSASESCQPPLGGDFNGDGRTDVIYRTAVFEGMFPQGPIFTASWNVALSSVVGAVSSGAGWQSFNGPPVVQGLPPFIGDYNGDGMTDLALQSGSTNYMFLSNGAGFSQAPNFIGCVNGIGHFTGNGKTDLWCRAGSETISVATSTGSSFTGMGPWISGWCASGQFDLADFNGDGKQDISCHPTDGTTKIALSTGAAFVDGGNWVTGFCATGQFGTGDFNGDGKLDVYCHPADGTTQVALSTGAAFTAPSTWFSSWCTTGTFGVGDFNGDGKTDVYCFNGGTVSIARSGAGLMVPDLLTSVSNGLGGTTTVAYTPSTTFQNTRLPFPVHVVSALTSNDGNGVVTTTSYSYKDGFYHLGEREFRGFNYARVTGPVGPNGEQSYSETWFHQGNDLAPPASDPPNGDVAIGYMRGKTYRTRAVDAITPSKVYSETITSYQADSDGQAPWFNPPAQVVNKIDNAAKETKIVYASYDAYGNVTREDNYGDNTGGNIDTSDDRTIVRTYANNTAAWFVGFLTTETMYQGLATTTPVAQTVLYYDGTATCNAASSNQIPTLGHLTRSVRIHLTDASKSLESRMAYDSYGNKVCSRDAKGNTTTLAYDSTSTFLKTTTSPSPANLVTTTQYYGVDGQPLTLGLYGQVMSVTDANGQMVTTTYDALGRQRTTTVPGTPTNLVTTIAYPSAAEFGQIGVQKVTSSTSGAGLPSTLVSTVFFDGIGRTIASEKTGTGATKIRTEQTYDVRGLVRSKTLPFITGQTGIPLSTSFYDAVGRVAKITHPDGSVSKVCYANRSVDTLDPKGHRRREVRDVYGRVVKVEQYEGVGADCSTLPTTVVNSVTYTYDILGNLLTSKDILNNTTTMTYNSLSQKVTMKDPDMGFWQYAYDLNGNLIEQLDAKNQKVCFTYDALNRRTQKNYGTAGGGGTSGTLTFTPEADTYLFENDPASNFGTTDYLQVAGTPDNGWRREGYLRFNVTGLPAGATVTSATLTVVNGGYSLSGSVMGGSLHQFTSSDPAWSETLPTWTARAGLAGSDASGPLATLGAVSQGGSYTFANLQSAVSGNGRVTFVIRSTDADGAGYFTKETATANQRPLLTIQYTTSGTAGTACGTNTVVYAYDQTTASNGKGRLTQVTDPAQSVTFHYDNQGRISQSAKTLDGTTYTTSSTYDGLGRLKTVTYPTTPAKTVTYNYTGPFLQNVTDGATTYVSYAGYNAFGQPISATFGNGVTTTYTYADLTNLSCSTPKSFRLCRLQTNGPGAGGGGASGTLTFTPEADTYLFENDPASNFGTTDYLQVAGTPDNGWRREGYLRFNVTGLPAGATVTSATLTVVNGGYSLSGSVMGGSLHQFTSSDPAWSETLPTWTARAGLAGSDASGPLATLGAVSQGGSYTFANLQSAVSGNGRVTFVIRSTDADGAGYFTKETATANQRPLLTIQYTTSGTAGTAYQDLQYAYDLAGNVTGIVDNLTALNTQTLTYDDLDRLDSATGNYGYYDYVYDAIGNMTTNPQLAPSSTAMTYPASGVSSVRPHAVSTAGGSTYTYDANGNMLTGAGRTYTWNQENKPLTVVQGGTTTTFVYDGDGGRVKKIVGATTTRYISKLYECDNGSCSRYVWAGSTRIAVVPDSASALQCNPACYFHGDHLGSSSVITGPTGLVVETMTYYPYGEVKDDSPGTPVNVPYKYTGKEKDLSTGLYYYEARYYDPKIGRFISADTIIPNLRDPQDLNRYTYAGNNPFKYTDPTGHLKIRINWKDVGNFFKREVVNFFCSCYSITSPEGRQYYASAVAAVIGTYVCGPVCGGAAAGAVSGALSKRDVGHSALIGAVAGAVTWGVGAGFESTGFGDYLVAKVAVAGAASGATQSALGGGNVWQAALIGGSMGAVSAYVQAMGVEPGQAQAAAGEAKAAVDIQVSPAEGSPLEFTQVGNVESQVVRSTIAISSDGVLSFNVRVTGLAEGSGFSTRLQFGMLQWSSSGQSFVNFRDWGTPIPALSIDGPVAHFGVSVSGITGPAYMRIIPYGLVGPPPVITNFGQGRGNFIPCGGGGSPCGSNLPYTQGY